MQLKGNIQVYERGEVCSFPDGWPDLPRGAKSRYGFKLVDSNGKLEWTHAQEADFRALLEGLGLDEQAIAKNLADVRNLATTNLCTTDTYHNTCTGGCIGNPSGFCSGYFDMNGRVYGCHCHLL